MNTLVNVRCHNCWRLLARIEAPPQDWSGTFAFSRCRNCDIPPHRRFVEVLIASGRNNIALGGMIPWSVLRKPIEDAWASGKPTDFPVRVTER